MKRMKFALCKIDNSFNYNAMAKNVLLIFEHLSTFLFYMAL